MSLVYSELGARQRSSDIARLMTLAIDRPDILSLAAGFTDTDSLPLAEVAEVVEEIRRDGDKTVLQYGANKGRGDLIEAMTARLSEQDGRRGSALYPADGGFVTNGSQQALYLAVQTLCNPGDIVLVEQPTYFVFLEMLRGLGVEAMPMPMTLSGDVDVAGLEALLSASEEKGILPRIKAVYLVTYYANPSGHSVLDACKRSIVELLSRFDGRIALLDDAAYRELYYETPFAAPSVLPLAEEAGVPVLYSTTLTKPFASGLKVGFGYCTDEDWLARMLAIKGQQDFGTAHFNQAILARIVVAGKLDAHLRTIRGSYRRKCDVLHECLEQDMGDSEWSWERPEGGLYLWLKAPAGVATDFESVFHARCLEAGVMYVPGDLCFAGHSDRSHVRLSFGVLDVTALREAGKRFARAVKGK